jgi:GNAT superfamily N-acetyltransferase
VETGSATAYILDRIEMSEASVDLLDLEEISETTEHLSQDPAFYDDCCEEIFLVFHEVLVKPESRRQGLGRRTLISSSNLSSKANKCAAEIVEAVLRETRRHLGHGLYALAAPGYLYAAVQREAVQNGVSMLDDKKVKEIMGRHLDAAGAFWRSVEFTPLETDSGRRSLFSTRLVGA